jgi:hypothetical protein
VFSIAPCFSPIHFAESPPLLTYICGPKGEALYLSIESFYFGGASIVSTFFCDGPIKITHCKKKKKSCTCEAPPANSISIPSMKAYLNFFALASCYHPQLEGIELKDAPMQGLSSA